MPPANRLGHGIDQPKFVPRTSNPLVPKKSSLLAVQVAIVRYAGLAKPIWFFLQPNSIHVRPLTFPDRRAEHPLR